MSNSNKTIVVAMSGGVDSSVVAAMLHRSGYNVIGITLQLYDYGLASGKPGTCCAGQDIYDAKRVADKLGFPHYVFNYESHFKEQVIDDFVESYINGETPLPCVRCNQSVKFHDLLKAAKELNADFLATGHYVRKILNNSTAELHKAISDDKDQSYFLFATTQEQLDYLMFPLGAQSKTETRKLAQEFELDIADKPDSQDICFVPNGNYRDVITKLRPDAQKKGRFVHIDGFDLGEHNGIINYTVGQRRGIGIAFHSPLYVIKLDAIKNVVYLGPESALVKKSFLLKNVNWLAKNIKIDDGFVTAKVRSTTKGVKAKIDHISDSEVNVTLYEEEKGISPGQACVFYHGSRVLGGGWIKKDSL